MARRADSSRATFWQELIERRRQQDLSVAQVCEQAGVSPPSFYQWQRKLCGGEVTERKGQPDRSAISRLVPVHIVADPPTGPSAAASLLEIELPGEIRLRIPAGCDRATLEFVVNLLRTGGSRAADSC